MVDTNTASTPGPGLTPPSFGPPSIPYVPPITFDEAIVRARVTIRGRERRGSRLLVISLVVLILPLLQAFSEIFPEDPYAKVTLAMVGFAAGVIGLFLFLGVSAYRLGTDRPRTAWVVLPVSALAAALAAYLVTLPVTAYLDAIPTGLADVNTLILDLISPVCLVVGSLLAVAGAVAARPRPVAVSVD